MATRTIVVQAPIALSGATSTNATVDLLGFTGVVKVDLSVCTNGAASGTGNAAGAGTLTATILQSKDTNTWTLTPYALATQSAISYTNNALAQGTNASFPTTYLQPGTWTVPTAGTAGFATPYLLPTPMTNTAVVTFTGSGVKEVEFNANDANRYLQVAWAATLDKTTNAVVTVTLSGYRSVGWQ
jgi:hypothetical protein